MSASTLRIVALLACITATSIAQQAPQTLDEVTVDGPKDRERKGGPLVNLDNPNTLRVKLDGVVEVQLRTMKEQPQVVFRRKSKARQLPGEDNGLSRINRASQLELPPDRLIASSRPWLSEAWFLLDAGVDEAEGVPAHIPFGKDVALVNLDHVGLRDGDRKARIGLENAMHPQTKQCEAISWVGDLWPDGANPYVLLGKSRKDCLRVSKNREGDLVFAENLPAPLSQAVRELYDPIASRIANRLGSEPGNMFVAWWADSPHSGFKLQNSWNRNSLLMFNGSVWQQGGDAPMRASLRTALMREQIARRIREIDWPGPFTRAAASYLLLLALAEEGHSTRKRLAAEVPTWITGCAQHIQPVARAGLAADIDNVECGLVLQFVYDAAARSRSGGKENAFSTWRRLLDQSFRRGRSGATPTEFLATSADARGIARGLVDGSIDWQSFAAALSGIGVNIKVTPGGSVPQFEVESLPNFKD